MGDYRSRPQRYDRAFARRVLIQEKRKREKEKRKMNTAIAVNASNTNPPVLSLVQDIPLNRIQESKTNPRRTLDEAKLAELAANIRPHGVLHHVLVRPSSNVDDGFSGL